MATLTKKRPTAIEQETVTRLCQKMGWVSREETLELFGKLASVVREAVLSIARDLKIDEQFTLEVVRKHLYERLEQQGLISHEPY